MAAERTASEEAARVEALTEAEMKALEERFDPEARFRRWCQKDAD